MSSIDITPVSSIATAWDATMAVVLKALPTDEMRLEALKRRKPLLYALTRIRVEHRIYNQIRKENKTPVTESIIIDFVNWDNEDLPDKEKEDLVKVLKHRFQIQ